MNKYLEQFYVEYNLFEKEYLPEEEQERLNSLSVDSDEQPFEKYDYEANGSFEYRFFKKIPLELSDIELNNIILYNLLQQTKEVNKKQTVIKNIMIFWLILTIIVVLLIML